MDYTLLADALRLFLAPALPFLLKAVAGASAEAGKKMGGAAAEKAQEVWGKLLPAVRTRPAAFEAAQDAAQAEDDTDAQTVWKVQLRKILEGDAALADVLSELLDRQHQMQAQVVGDGAIAQGAGAVAAGKGGVAVGGDVRGSVIITSGQRDDG